MGSSTLRADSSPAPSTADSEPRKVMVRPRETELVTTTRHAEVSSRVSCVSPKTPVVTLVRRLSFIGPSWGKGQKEAPKGRESEGRSSFGRREIKVILRDAGLGNRHLVGGRKVQAGDDEHDIVLPDRKLPFDEPCGADGFSVDPHLRRGI